MSDDTAIADDELWTLMSRLPTPFSRVAEGQDRLGFGLRPCQGFPVRGSISAGRAIDAAPALFKPDGRFSRIRLYRPISLQDMHRESSSDNHNGRRPKRCSWA
jgi:hypothetical protein